MTIILNCIWIEFAKYVELHCTLAMTYPEQLL